MLNLSFVTAPWTTSRILVSNIFFCFPAGKPWIYEQKIMPFAHRTALAGVPWQCGFFFNFRDQLHVVGDCSWARSRANMRARKWSREKFVGAAVGVWAEFFSTEYLNPPPPLRKAVPATFTLIRVPHVNGDRVTKDTDVIKIMLAEDMHTQISLKILQELKLSLK